MANDRAAIPQIVAVACGWAVALAVGCGLLFPPKAQERVPEGAPASVAVPVTRVPVEREPLPLPEYPESFAVAAPAPTDDPATLATKKELAALVAEIEAIKAKTAEEVYRLQQAARQELQNAQKEKDVELAALEAKLQEEARALAEQSRAGLYDMNKWQWAILAAAIAAVAYAYKRLSLTAALIALGGFAFLFSLVLAGQHYPRLVALAPVPFTLLVAYAAWKYGVVRRALVACARGIEIADNDLVKEAVRRQAGSEGVETVRKEIDQATVDLARARAGERRREAKEEKT